eukprot:symbB.v1.2.010440.t1/scaffold680.1/size173138/3
MDVPIAKLCLEVSIRNLGALGVNLAGYAGTIFPQDDADEKSRPKWVTILTRADFVPTEDVLDMNHWLPAWFSDQCDDFDKVHGQELKVIDEQLALLVNNVGEDWEAYLRQRKALDHFRELQSKLGEDEHRILTRQVFDLLLPGGDPPDDPDELKDEKVEAGDEQQLPGENMLSMNTGQDHEHLLKDVPPPKISKHDRLCSTAGLAKPQAPFARSWDSLAGSVRQPEDDPEKDMEKTQGAKSRLVKEKGSKKKDQKDIQKDQEKVEQKTKRGRQKQLSVIKAMGTKNFLYDMGLDYSTWMKCHYDAAACKKTVACPAGGFRSLQEHLLSAKSVESLKCKICCRILINRKFDLVKLQDHLDALIAENETKRSHLGLGVVHIQDVDIEGAAQASVPAGPDGGFASVGPTDFVKVEPSVWTETNLHDPVVDEDDYDDLPLNALCEMPKPVKRRRMAQSDIDLAKAWHRFLTGLGFDEREISEKPELSATFTILPLGTAQKKFPVQCLVCSNIVGKRVVVDAVKRNTWAYLKSHMESGRHKTCLEKQKRMMDQKGVVNDDGKGFAFEARPNARISLMREEFELYAAYTKIDGARQTKQDEEGDAEECHRYVHDITTNKFTIFHRRCEKTFVRDRTCLTLASSFQSGHRDMCPICTSLATDKSLVRNTGRFYCKYMAAALLKARLTNLPPAQEVVTQMLESAVFKYSKFEKELEMLSKLSVPELQKYVRISFLSIPPSKQSDRMKFFQSSTVLPIVTTYASDSSHQQVEKVERMAHALTEGHFATVSDVDLKLGCFVASGLRSQHPMVQGILVAMVEKIRRANRGVHSFRGLKLSPHESALMAEAGISLSLSACNKRLLQDSGVLAGEGRWVRVLLAQPGVSWGTKEAAAACFLQLPDASQNSESGQTEGQDQNLLQKLDLANVDFAEEMMVALQWDPSTKIKGLPRFPAALFLNPYFLIAEVPGVNAEGTFQPPEVPWSLRGALLINLVQSLVQSAVMHQKLSVAQRLENSMTCHVLLDICRLLSHEREQQWSLPRGSCFLATQTVDDEDSGEEDEVEVSEPKKPKLNPDETESPNLKGADKECYDLMKSLQEQEAKIASGQDEAKENFNVLEMDELKCLHVGTSARPILDEDDLAKCTTAAAEERAGRVPASGPVPRRCFTLASLLDIPHIQSDLQSKKLFSHLWQLVVNLRTGDGGCDAKFIRCHQNSRSVSRTLNWHQWAEHQCKVLNDHHGTCGNRISRSQAWKAEKLKELSASVVVNCSPFRIACLLSHEPAEVETDKFEVALTASSLKAFQMAHTVKWPKQFLQEENVIPARTLDTKGSPKKSSPKKRPKTGKVQDEAGQDDSKKQGGVDGKDEVEDAEKPVKPSKSRKPTVKSAARKTIKTALKCSALNAHKEIEALVRVAM